MRKKLILAMTISLLAITMSLTPALAYRTSFEKSGGHHYLASQYNSYKTQPSYGEKVGVAGNVRVSDLYQSRTDGKIDAATDSDLNIVIAIEAFTDPALDMDERSFGYSSEAQSVVQSIEVSIKARKPNGATALQDLGYRDLDNDFDYYLDKDSHSSSDPVYEAAKYVYDAAKTYFIGKLPYAAALSTAVQYVEDLETSESEFTESRSGNRLTYKWDYGTSGWGTHSNGKTDSAFIIELNPNLGKATGTYRFDIDVKVNFKINWFEAYSFPYSIFGNDADIKSGASFSFNLDFEIYRGSKTNENTCIYFNGRWYC